LQSLHSQIVSFGPFLLFLDLGSLPCGIAYIMSLSHLLSVCITLP
jgi:hypothetical protein